MKERLFYIDSLRGLAILMVLYFHLSIHIGKSSLTPLYIQYFLHTFFFLSGYLIYKGDLINIFSSKNLLDKFSTLVIPAIVIGSINIWYFNKDIINVFFDDSKGGYWFTYVMFAIICLYSIISRVSKILKCFNIGERANTYLLLASVLLVEAFRYHTNTESILGDLISLNKICVYYKFFIFGLIYHKYKHYITVLYSHKFYGTLLFLTAVGFNVLPIDVPSLVRPFFVVNTIIVLFYILETHNDSLNKNIVGKTLIIFGKYSLPIYLIHYFFLSKYSFVNIAVDYIVSNNLIERRLLNYASEFFFIGGLAILISCICVIIAKIIEISPILSLYVLGKK